MLTNKQLKEAVKALNNNEIIVLPTDTIYGFSGVLTPKMVEKINNLKKAPIDKPLIALFSSIEDLKKTVEINELSNQLLQNEEPITIIAPNLNLSLPYKTLGVRLVKRPDLKMIIESVGPIWSTSVNQHGSPSLTKIGKISEDFPEIIVFEDKKSTSNGQASRIYDQQKQSWIR